MLDTRAWSNGGMLAHVRTVARTRIGSREARRTSIKGSCSHGVAVCAISALAFLALLLPETGLAAGIVTDCSTFGPGAGTFADALDAGGLVSFNCDGTIVVPQIDIATDTEIRAGENAVTLSGDGSNRVFYVHPNVTLEVHELAITNGFVPEDTSPEATDEDQSGGAVFNAGTLVMEDCSVTHSQAHEHGGGIFTKGSMQATRTEVASNVAYSGGGIFNRGGSVDFWSGNIRSNEALLGLFGGGGGVFNEGGSVSVLSSEVKGNLANGPGGGFFTRGDLVVGGSVVVGNRSVAGDGGAIFSASFYPATALIRVAESRLIDNIACEGAGIENGFQNDKLVVSGSDISGNLTSCNRARGGGILNLGHLEIDSSTLASNSANTGGNNGKGGGLYNDLTAQIDNSTISGNSSDNGGGIYNTDPFGIVVFRNVTVTTNNADVAGDGIFSDSQQIAGLSFQNTLLDDACAGDGMVLDRGNNLDSGDTCGLTASSSLTNADPRLGALADNLGLTLTHALLAGSAAIDAGDNGLCKPVVPIPGRDQRGIERPDGDQDGPGTCDIGAVEFADCDVSGVDDGTEIAEGTLTDADGNKKPDVCQMPDIDVKPLSVPFGSVDVGEQASHMVTIANLGDLELNVSGASVTEDSDPAFSVTDSPPVPIEVAREGGTLVVELRFAPTVGGIVSGTFEITSDDPDEPTVLVALDGEGVPLEDQAGDIIDEVDDALGGGDLESSSGQTVKAFRNLLELAENRLAEGDLNGACTTLQMAFEHADGVEPPDAPPTPDFVTGTAAEEIAAEIVQLMTNAGCP